MMTTITCVSVMTAHLSNTIVPFLTTSFLDCPQDFTPTHFSSIQPFVCTSEALHNRIPQDPTLSLSDQCLPVSSLSP